MFAKFSKKYCRIAFKNAILNSMFCNLFLDCVAVYDVNAMLLSGKEECAPEDIDPHLQTHLICRSVHIDFYNSIGIARGNLEQQF
jgi:hypothetical protein